MLISRRITQHSVVAYFEKWIAHQEPQGTLVHFVLYEAPDTFGN